MTSQTPDLPWMIVAKSYVGLKENTSKKVHNSTILKWLTKLKAWLAEDETPWCGVFTAECLLECGFTKAKANSIIQPKQYPFNWFRAGDWRADNKELLKPAYGCIAVKVRKGGNHVFFVVGKTASGKIVGLGGNQSNAVSYALYDSSELDFYWFGTTAKPSQIRYDLPIISNVTATKVSEA